MWGVVSKYGSDIMLAIDSTSTGKMAVLGAAGGAAVYAADNYLDDRKRFSIGDTLKSAAAGGILAVGTKKFGTSIYAQAENKFSRAGMSRDQFDAFVASAGGESVLGKYKGFNKSSIGDTIYEFDNYRVNKRTGKKVRYE